MKWNPKELDKLNQLLINKDLSGTITVEPYESKLKIQNAPLCFIITKKGSRENSYFSKVYWMKEKIFIKEYTSLEKALSELTPRTLVSQIEKLLVDILGQ